jgi:stress-induced morphogen
VTLQNVIEQKLRHALSPAHLEVVNESYMHASGKNNPAAETHFKVIVVSERFEGLNPVKRHQLVYGALGDELRMKKGIHALAITSRTPGEWEARPEANVSPKCAGGDGTRE